MNAQETTGIRELTAQYLEYVSGGAVDGNDGNDALALMALANATWREYRSARSGIPSPPAVARREDRTPSRASSNERADGMRLP
jgi:hypothetical protein